MERVLKGLVGVICMIYMDDIVVFSKNMKEHATHLQQIFDRLREHKLTLNPKKCVFGMTELKLLGYIINEKGLKADPEKCAAISKLKAPSSVPEIRSFLGMSGYYRSCINSYAHISEPLVALTRKNSIFRWGPEEQRSFDLLKESLVSEQIMAHPQIDKPWKLYSDACNYAIGSILCQDDSEGVERPVVYLSKQLTPTQRKWSTIEKEAYALTYAITKLRPYLWGAEFTCYTDHRPLVSLFSKEHTNAKIQRWALLLNDYNCNIVYHRGKMNIRADFLSRIKTNEPEISVLDTNDWVYGEPMEVDPDDPMVPSLDLDKLKSEQQKLPYWKEASNEESEYDIIEGLLYSTKRPYKYAPDHPRLVLPECSQNEAIKTAHIEVGHMGPLKTLRKLQESYVWPGMQLTVKEYIKKCPTCIVYRTKQVELPMGEMPEALAPGQIVGMDLIGPFVVSPDGNTYALTIVDHCTGWAEVYAIPKKTNEAVWSKLCKEYFPRHGYPDIMISDLGQEFNALAFREYLKKVGVNHRRTTSYNPQSNGKAERFNKTFKSILNKLINNHRNHWEEQLGVALTAYNNATSTVTGQTPYFLHYGRRARLPLQMAFSEALNPLSPLEGRLKILSDGLAQAGELTRVSRHLNRTRLAKRAKVQDVKVGDAVVLKANEPLSMTSKWDPQWTVTQVRDKVVWLRHGPSGKTKIVNRNKVQIVDPNIAWDEVNPRPIRKSNVSSKKQGVVGRPAGVARPQQGAHAAGGPIQLGASDDHGRPKRKLPARAPRPAPKRSRPYQPRAAKRKTETTEATETKRNRIEVVFLT